MTLACVIVAATFAIVIADPRPAASSATSFAYHSMNVVPAVKYSSDPNSISTPIRKISSKTAETFYQSPMPKDSSASSSFGPNKMSSIPKIVYAPSDSNVDSQPKHFGFVPSVNKYYATVQPQKMFRSVEVETPVEHFVEPHYEFEYSVDDPHTGDVKTQHESRKNGVVVGSYSLIDPDGYKRIVEYTADAHNGFNAVVKREPLNYDVVVPKYVEKVENMPRISKYHN